MCPTHSAKCHSTPSESIRRAAILIHAPPEVCSAMNLLSVFCILLRSCFFGWGGASFAFGVFTRALRQIIPSHMYGIFDMFVDDLMGFAHHSVVARGQQTAQYTETIRPSNRGCRKLLWAFFLVPQAAHQESKARDCHWHSASCSHLEPTVTL